MRNIHPKMSICPEQRLAGICICGCLNIFYTAVRCLTINSEYEKNRAVLPPPCNFLLVLNVESLFKSVNTTASVNQFLFTSKEWVTFGTYVNTDFSFCRFCVDYIATSTCNNSIFIFWMDVFSHFDFTSLSR